MKKPNKPAKSRNSSRRSRSSGQLADGSIDQQRDEVARGILSVVTGGSSPSVAMSCTHHGFVAEAFELNGQLEQVINHVRKHFPKLRID